MIILPASPTNPDNARIGWESRLTALNVSADEEAVDHPVTELANPLSFLYWQGETAIEQSVQIFDDSGDPVDYIAIARHNFGSAGIEYIVEYSTDGGSIWNPATSQTAPTDDAVIIHEFAAQTATLWRLRMLAGTEPPRIAILYLGQILELSRRFYVGHTPFNYGRDHLETLGVSESGQFLGRIIRRRLYSNAIALKNLDPAWYRSNFEPFAAAAETLPFFFAWRPTSWPNEVGLVWSTGNFQPDNQRGNGMMQVNVRLQGFIA